MRLLAVSMLLILAEARAGACPSGTSCVADQTRLAAAEAIARSSKERGSWADSEATSAVEHARDELARPMRARATTLLGHALAHADLASSSFAPRAGHDSLAHSLRTHVAVKPRSGQLPAFWVAVRKRVYSKMPSYERRGGVSLVVSPVVVDSPSDTVPGLGVEGAF